MRLTRRGIVVVCLVGFALLQGYVFDARALNYVVAPGVAALIVGAVLLGRTEEPTVERSTVRSGFPGEKRRETITVEGGGVATVIDEPPEGIEGGIERTVSLPCRIDRELRFGSRGVYTLGPTIVCGRDPLGLFATEFEFDDRTELTVFPEIYDLDRSHVLDALFGDARHVEGQSFERLREYQDGDPLGHIHWKSTAKYDELLVVDFDSRQRAESVHVVVDGRGMGDDLATAAASVVCVLLDVGLEVSMTVPGDRIESGRGSRHRTELLGALAGGDRSSRGRTSNRYHPDEADIVVFEKAEAVIVRLGETESPFDRLRSGTTEPITHPSEPTRGIDR